MATIEIRVIQSKDDAELANIIRQVLVEFDANKPGFAWQDPELDHLTQAYSQPRSQYLVASQNGKLLGGAGIAPLPGFEQETCELQKMYLLPDARGKGVGEALLNSLVTQARHFDYEYCYLETLHTMAAANHLYKKLGFKYLPEPLADTGHGGCNSWLIKRL